MPTHLLIRDNPAFKEASVVQLEQIRTIDKRRIDNYLGKVTPREMVAIEKTFDTNAEAKKRKLQVEYEQESGTFIPPSAKTVNDLLEEYMSIYGVNTWAMSTYESRKSLIANYIRPLIGDMKLEDVSPRIMDKYYRDLLTVKAVSTKHLR